MTANGEFSDPAEQERAEGPEPVPEPDATQHYELERIPEPEPGPGPEAEPTEFVEVIIPSSQHLPVPRPPVGVVVRRRRLALLYGLIALLLVVLGGMAYAMISNNHKQLVAVDSTTSATPSAQASPADTGSDATDDASSSASASGDPATSGSASPGTSASDGGSATSTDPSSSDDPSSAFTPPFGTEYLPAPVDGDVYTQQDVHISDIDYANSSSFYCPTSGLIDWNVAGYSTFTAQYGIPDDAQYATGITNTITFTDQNGKTLDVQTTSIGQPVKLSFSVSGVDRLIMSCARQGSNNSANNLVALGNASLSTS